MNRIVRMAVAVWVPIAGFAIVNRAFEERVLEPVVGREIAETLAAATLAGFVFAVGVLWLGARERSLGAAETAAVSATWAAAAAALSALASGTPYFGGWREALVLLAASAAAPWFVRGLRPGRRRLSGAG